MIGQDYFKDRLGRIYRFSIIPYMYGYNNGACFLLVITSILDLKYLKILLFLIDRCIFCSWELCVDVSGEIIFILTSNNFHTESLSKINLFTGISCENNWIIECKEIYILNIKSYSSNSQKYVNKSFCRPSSIKLVQNSKDSKIDLARAYLNNFHKVDSHNFYVNIQEKEIFFRMIDNSKDILNLIETKRLSGAIFSEMIIPFDKSETIETVNHQIKSISWFLSFLSLNLTFPPVIRYYSGEEIIQYSINNYDQHPLNQHYSIIDNSYVYEGISKAFNSSYYEYVVLQANFSDSKTTLNFNRLIGLLVDINQQKNIDVKIAVMIVAYEYLLSKYLQDQGLPESEIKKIFSKN